MIGYDRYNVICKGITGHRMTYDSAVQYIVAIWVYCVIVSVPPFFGWGEYALGICKINITCVMKYTLKYYLTEGLLVTCSYDYMSTDWNRMSFLLYAFIGNYAVPLVVLIYFYVLIVKAVIEHEQHLRKAAELMNVKDVSELLLNI